MIGRDVEVVQAFKEWLANMRRCEKVQLPTGDNKLTFHGGVGMDSTPEGRGGDVNLIQ